MYSLSLRVFLEECSFYREKRGDISHSIFFPFFQTTSSIKCLWYQMKPNETLTLFFQKKIQKKNTKEKSHFKKQQQKLDKTNNTHALLILLSRFFETKIL